MTFVVIAFIGIVVAVAAIGLGLIVGESERIAKDPEVQANIERQRREHERQQAWKDKWK